MRVSDNVVPDQFDIAREMFTRRSTYGRFKDILAHRALPEQSQHLGKSPEERAVLKRSEGSGVKFDV